MSKTILSSFSKNALDFFKSLIIHPEMEFKTSWNDAVSVSQSSVEAVFKMNTTENTMTASLKNIRGEIVRSLLVEN